jgi:hypothetical protein
MPVHFSLMKIHTGRNAGATLDLNSDLLAYDLFARKLAFNEFKVAAENQLNGFLQILTRFSERVALCVSAWQLFDICQPLLSPVHRNHKL